MPLTFRLEADRRLVTCTGRGALCGDELAALGVALRAAPGFDPDHGQLWDFGGVTEITIAFQDMLWLAGADAFATNAHRAIHAPADAVFGTARMFAMVREAQGETGCRVFRELAEARAWVAGSAASPIPDGADRANAVAR